MVKTTYHHLKKYLQIRVEILQEMQVEVRLQDWEDRGVEVHWEGLQGPALSLLRNLIPNLEIGIPRDISVEQLEKSAEKIRVLYTPPAVETDPVCLMGEREDLLQMEGHGKKFLQQDMQHLQR